MRRFLLAVLTITLAACLFSGNRALAAPRLQDVSSEKKVVIVIDPGHGGENLGTTQNNHMEGEHSIEKNMTMITALAMYDELILYDNVEVYLTRTKDIDISLKERAQFAESMEADFLFSIHYNASENHEAFGAEVWASAFQPYNGYGYQFGYEILSDLREKGLLVRGIKTRLTSKGEDYYGIIRESVGLGVPAVIIEHCHVDEEHDAEFCDDEEKLKAFGRMDATAAARYFGLKSSILHVDYSEDSLAEASGTSKIKAAANDKTKPDMCAIEFSHADYGRGRLGLKVSAADYDSTLLYYSFSLDGGRTFSARKPWPESDALTCSYRDTFTLNLDIPPGIRPRVIVRAYNSYDMYTESNLYTHSETFGASQGGGASDLTSGGSEGISSFTGENPAAEGGIRILRMDEALLKYGQMGEPGAMEGADVQREENGLLLKILTFGFGLAGILLVLLTVLQGMIYHSRRKRRAQWRNEAGNNSSQPR